MFLARNHQCVSWIDRKFGREMLTDQHVLRVVVGPGTPNFPPGMSDAHSSGEIIVAEVKLLGEVGPD